MLGRLHKQLAAARLADLTSSCSLVLIYQTLGGVGSSTVSNLMQAELDACAPNSGVTAQAFKIKNGVAAGAKVRALEPFLQAENLLAGWQLPQAASVLDQLQANKATQLPDIIKAAPRSKAHSHPPQNIMSALISLSTALPNKLPVVLLAGFYRGERVGLGFCHHATKAPGSLQAWPCVQLCAFALLLGWVSA